MNELIPLQLQTIDGNTVETVSARELHSFLESRQDFSTWIKNRIERYEFVENQDFIKLHKKMELSKTGQMTIEYFIKNPIDSRPLFLRLRLGSIKLWSAKSKWTTWLTK